MGRLRHLKTYIVFTVCFVFIFTLASILVFISTFVYIVDSFILLSIFLILTLNLNKYIYCFFLPNNSNPRKLKWANNSICPSIVYFKDYINDFF